MQGCKTITTALPPPTVVLLISGANAESLAGSDYPPTASPSVPSDPRMVQDDSASYREDILRRYESPFEMGWLCGGLNE
jgi:hypothetical protein